MLAQHGYHCASLPRVGRDQLTGGNTERGRDALERTDRWCQQISLDLAQIAHRELGALRNLLQRQLLALARLPHERPKRSSQVGLGILGGTCRAVLTARDDLCRVGPATSGQGALRLGCTHVGGI